MINDTHSMTSRWWRPGQWLRIVWSVWANQERYRERVCPKLTDWRQARTTIIQALLGTVLVTFTLSTLVRGTWMALGTRVIWHTVVWEVIGSVTWPFVVALLIAILNTRRRTQTTSIVSFFLVLGVVFGPVAGFSAGIASGVASPSVLLGMLISSISGATLGLGIGMLTGVTRGIRVGMATTAIVAIGVGVTGGILYAKAGPIVGRYLLDNDWQETPWRELVRATWAIRAIRDLFGPLSNESAAKLAKLVVGTIIGLAKTTTASLGCLLGGRWTTRQAKHHTEGD